LSANHTVFAAQDGAPATVVDTGHARHAPLTVALVRHALGGELPQRIVNTHLHSDHCGGNHALQQAGTGAGAAIPTWVPAGGWAAAHAWDQARLSYQATGQHCPRFETHGALLEGDMLRLGRADWQVLAAPGHDPDALMLFEPQTRTLLAGDALWESRLAIIFPELEDQPGFGATRATLARIEALAPRWVIPGHGAAFEDAGAALAASRARLAAFERQPERHTRHAARALTLFHMMEVAQQPRAHLEAWLVNTPICLTMARQLGVTDAAAWARALVAELLDQGLLVADSQDALHLPPLAPD
jgi:glyoxylase-like metal-dependent hydrolase (beta-lactamase superfamily II)